MTSASEPTRPLLAVEVTARCELSQEARQLDQHGVSARAFFSELVQRAWYDDALSFAAHYMTPREAVWWGCLCLWQDQRSEQATVASPAARSDDAATALLDDIVRWVAEPNEARRRTVKSAARSLRLAHPAANLSLAVFYSGGSISLPEAPHVEPPAGQAARAVLSAVRLALRLTPRGVRSQYQHHCLELASEVSCGQIPWSAAVESTTEKELAHGDAT